MNNYYEYRVLGVDAHGRSFSKEFYVKKSRFISLYGIEFIPENIKRMLVSECLSRGIIVKDIQDTMGL